MLRCLDVSLTQAQVGGCCCSKEDLLCRAVNDRGGGADWNADSLPAQERSRNSGMDEVIIIDELRLYDRTRASRERRCWHVVREKRTFVGSVATSLFSTLPPTRGRESGTKTKYTSFTHYFVSKMCTLFIGVTFPSPPSKKPYFRVNS